MPIRAPQCKWRIAATQVSFGVHKSEQDAARQYDRALIIVKGRLAKTNFPMTDYEAEVKTFEAYLLSRRVMRITSDTGSHLGLACRHVGMLLEGHAQSL